MEFTFDGINFDQEIEGYITTNASGRSFTLRRSAIKDRASGDGGRAEPAFLQARKVQVYYILRAKNSQEFRERLDRLHFLLDSRTDCPFSFSDERLEYRGRLNSYSEPPMGQLEGEGSFQLLCPDPFKYGPLRSFDPTAIPAEFTEPANLESITIQVAGSPASVSLTNMDTGDFINLARPGGYSPGDSLVVEWGRTIEVRLNGLPHREAISLFSRVEDFRVQSGDSLAVSPTGCSVTIRARKRALHDLLI